MTATHEHAGIAAGNGVNVIWDAPTGSFKEIEELHDRIRWGIHKNRLGTGRRRGGGWNGITDYLLTAASKGNVWLRRIGVEPKYIAVVLYDSEIVRYYPDDTFSVDNCGFNTPTTMYRVTQFTPDGFHVWHQDKMLALYGEGRSVLVPATHDTRIEI